MSFWQRLWQHLAAPPPSADFWYVPIAQPTYTGKFVNEQTSLQCSAVYACVRVIAETVASLPFNVYRRLPEGGKRVATEHPVHYLIHDSPNEELTAYEFWETLMLHVLTWGNAYARVLTGARDVVTALIPIPPDRVEVRRDLDTGVRYYRISEPGKDPEILFDDQILHIPGLGYDGLRGYSPIEMQRQAVGLALAAEEYGARFFGNNAAPPMYLHSTQQLTDKSKENLMQWFSRKFGGVSNSHKLGILDNGVEIKTVPINHRDIQFLELRKFQIEEIARIFRVPLHLIQNLDRSTHNNIENQSIDFAMHTIRPWLVRIEKRVNKALFGPRESGTYFAEFVMEGLLRGDAKSRAEFYTAMRNAGIMTANEIREKENLNPLPGGDELFIQGAMVPVSQAARATTEESAV